MHIPYRLIPIYLLSLLWYMHADDNHYQLITGRLGHLNPVAGMNRPGVRGKAHSGPIKGTGGDFLVIQTPAGIHWLTHLLSPWILVFARASI